MQRLKPAVGSRWLLLISGLLWTATGITLCMFAYGWLSSLPSSNVERLLAGAILAACFYRFGFSSLAFRNIQRIYLLPRQVCVFAFQAPRSYFLVLVMMSFGILLRESPFPKSYLAVMYIAMGGALLLSSLHYYARLLDRDLFV